MNHRETSRNTLPPRLAPSMLASDFSCLADEARRVTEAGADWLHLDVMDGHFVPNLTFGAPVIKALRSRCRVPFDVHLMIEEPGRHLDDFIEAGSDWITFHVEADSDPVSILDRIHAAGRKGGLALRPGTPVDEILEFVPLCDIVLVMTVEPGFGGQAFMPEPLAKIDALLQVASECGRPLEIEVDGGIDLQTLPLARMAGANVFVAGSAIFRSADVSDTVRRFRQRMEASP